MNDEELAELAARRERYAVDIQEFCDVYAGEYVREVSWRWVGNDPDDFEAEVVLELYDGSTRRIPLDYDGDETAMGIRCGDAGFIQMDATGLYAYLWNEDATELQKTREALAKERKANALLRQHNMQLLVRLARALYDAEVVREEISYSSPTQESTLKFHEQTADVQKAYIDLAWAEAMGDNGAEANEERTGR